VVASCPRSQTPGPSFLVINADESEPGSCKDREIIRHDPHKLIEGALIAGFAMRARAAYIYIRGDSSARPRRCSRGAEATMPGCSARTRPVGLRLRRVRPPRAGRLHLRRRDRDAESLEGKKGSRASSRHFPAGAGLYGCPTTVNNVESIAWCRPSCGAARLVQELRPREE
jgi:NADH-quinone oxidoreductase subunit F